VIGALLASLLLVLAACADERRGRPAPDPHRLVTQSVGRGAGTTTIVRPATDRPLPVVLFLHGWGAMGVEAYRPWVEHLAREGNVVLFPRYQDSVVDPPAQVLGNVLAGVRLALRQVRARPGTLVVAGHSAGGALAADYAAIAASAGLPVPVGVFAAYPGRRLAGIPFAIPAVDPSRIAPRTRVLALASDEDRVVGTTVARAIVRGATRVPREHRRLVLVEDPAVEDHLGPQRAGEASRRAFWARLDALIRRARG
jgi:acetyl esterase/lipase